MVAASRLSNAMPSIDPGIQGDYRAWRQSREQLPTKLYALLEIAAAGGFGLSSTSVTWLPHGRAFKIVDEARFLEDIVPMFFSLSKMKSLRRQLYMWGFRKLCRGPDEGAWHHKHFLRGRPGQMEYMVRIKIRGGMKEANDPQGPPNFYGMPTLPLPDPAAFKLLPPDRVATSTSSSNTDRSGNEEAAVEPRANNGAVIQGEDGAPLVSEPEESFVPVAHNGTAGPPEPAPWCVEINNGAPANAGVSPGILRTVGEAQRVSVPPSRTAHGRQDHSPRQGAATPSSFPLFCVEIEHFK